MNTTFMHCDAKSTKITFGEVLFLFEGIATTCSSKLFSPVCLLFLDYTVRHPRLWRACPQSSGCCLETIFLPAGPRQPHNCFRLFGRRSQQLKQPSKRIQDAPSRWGCRRRTDGGECKARAVVVLLLLLAVAVAGQNDGNNRANDDSNAPADRGRIHRHGGDRDFLCSRRAGAATKHTTNSGSARSCVGKNSHAAVPAAAAAPPKNALAADAADVSQPTATAATPRPSKARCREQLVPELSLADNRR